ncbi:hypothetical protein UPYG_G00105540 [Umbra pygmaea]|uniref:Fringe-like glycosyltransferase domain-containing protein n=1 Tax=Umbra pygmaea TaxID=75934 RepID=A0ABD0X5J4_UMBPY
MKMTLSKPMSKSLGYPGFMFCAGFGFGFFLMAITNCRVFQIYQDMLHSQTSRFSAQLSAVAHTASFSPFSPSPISSGLLLCWVLTSPNTLWTRAKHITTTWGRHCDTLLFMSSKPDLKFPGTVVALETEEGRKNLYNKTITAFQILHDGYLDKADWFLKADDNTYVIVDNLRVLLSQFNPDSPVYMGRRFQGFVHQGYMSGGAGYVLSREAVRRYAQAVQNGNCTLSKSPEDVALGICLQKLGVHAGDSRDPQRRETFHPLWLGSLLSHKHVLPKWFPQYNYNTTKLGSDCCSSTSVSFQYCKPVKMYMLDYFLYHLSPVGGHRLKLDQTRFEEAVTETKEKSAAAGGGTHCLQPLRATVPFQLHNKAQPRCKDAKTGERNKCRPPKPTIRRTLSLETIVGPYLQGHWPKESETQGVSCVNDKATQTPISWAKEPRGRRSVGGHKRSASWGSAEHLREVAKLRHQLQKRSRQAPPPGGPEPPHPPPTGCHAPGATQTVPLTPLSRLAPRLRRSVEGLNLELEGVFVSEKPEDKHKILDVPDGHRAPVPAQRYSSASQSDPSPASVDSALLSPSSSPCALDPALLTPSPRLIGQPEPVDCETLCPSPPPAALDPSSLQPSYSPRPNKTYSFQREPPEGCERVPVVCEEPMSPCHREPFLKVSCPDPNKVNFTPHGGSAFCPVSLLKPLLPSMDLMFRGLSVSPVTGCSGQGSAPY